MTFAHTSDAIGAGKLLGGQNFTSCEALGASSATATASSTPATYTGAVGKVNVGAMLGLLTVLTVAATLL